MLKTKKKQSTSGQIHVQADKTMIPTPERLRKSDFAAGRPHRVVTALDALLKSGDISDEAYAAARKWRRDYLFARFGYQEISSQRLGTTYYKHDEISWRMTRAEVWRTLAEIRTAIGAEAHRRLEWGLIEEVSFTQMAAKIMPHRRVDDARKRVSAQFALTLSRLDEVYQERRRQEVVKRRLLNTNT